MSRPPAVLNGALAIWAPVVALCVIIRSVGEQGQAVDRHIADLAFDALVTPCVLIQQGGIAHQRWVRVPILLSTLTI